TLMSMVVVYFHYYKLLPLLFQRRYLLYFVLTFLMVSTVNVLYVLVDSEMPYEYPMDSSYWSSYGYNLLSLILILIVSSMFYYVREWHLGREREEQLRAEKLQTELHLLRSQINPHFLFNTLNNIYSYVQTGNEKAAPMIERLSGILRFMVYDCTHATVELNKEIEVIENLLEIHRMKSASKVNIRFNFAGNKGYHLVAPLILVNLVENACKHSDAVNNPKGYIRVEIQVQADDMLYFTISNSIKRHTGSTTLTYGGVGLKNMKKRLSLLYGDQYSLTESNDGHVYRMELKLPLERKK
ncbi:MAG: histidine kinase, partial [Bacteroidota bacterium]